MTHLTKRQHYVPRAYLRGWADQYGQIAAHDLKDRKCIKTSPENVMGIRWFYEEDTTSPDNRIEKALAAMEGATASVLAKFSAVLGREPDPRRVIQQLQRMLSPGDTRLIKEFACYQYVRVPGAIGQKEFELQASPLTSAEKAIGLNPGRFTESGFQYILPKMAAMVSQLWISSGREFITSDWPCFDMQDSSFAPALGEDIGSDPRVVVYCPLAPRVSLILHHKDFSDQALGNVKGVINLAPDCFVKTVNALVVQQAERWVVASREEKFISDIAKKRTKPI